MTGSIDVIASMSYLRQVWLHGNQFTGTIPHDIGNLTSLLELSLNGNKLVGLIPNTLANIMDLKILVLDNNMFMGPIPAFDKTVEVTYGSNYFCQSKLGAECAPEVTALLDFLQNLNHPSLLIPQWVGNEPCRDQWFGLSCNSNSEVSMINLPRKNLSGTLSPSLVKLGSLLQIKLAGNNITGKVPISLTELKSLNLLDLANNNVEPPLPKFHESVDVFFMGNPLLANQAGKTAAPISSPPPHNLSAPPPPPSIFPPSSSSVHLVSKPNKFRFKNVVVVGVAIFAILCLLVISLFIWCCLKKKKSSIDPEKMVISCLTNTSDETESSHVSEDGNLVLSFQVLRKVANDFAPQNELGHGGFGTVYKGVLEDGTEIAVKRMNCGAYISKAVDEFQAEISVLSKVRHRDLVSLLGYSIEGNERLLVYEYMPLGTLSRHLFNWKSLNLEPLSLSKRLAIALDVARGMEYLHSLARETFIHRDLKPSNILLWGDFRAKVSDFGLVKLAPDGQKSMATRLAGTFGYLAPEYAVLGKVTTKVDVYSYGVVLMELLTGLSAIDESRPEEKQYLAEWFWEIISNKEKLMAAIDPALDVTEESFRRISIVAELAGHCTTREPKHRPDMGHAVKVLTELVEKWLPVDEVFDCGYGVDYSQQLPQLLQIWKEAEGIDTSYAYTSLDDKEGSIPTTKPTGFADSFISSDSEGSVPTKPTDFAISFNSSDCR